jgi:hypothetical protein
MRSTTSRPGTRVAALLAAAVLSFSLIGAGAMPGTAHAMDKHISSHLK